jgi:hypothetical protein
MKRRMARFATDVCVLSFQSKSYRRVVEERCIESHDRKLSAVVFAVAFLA